MTPLVTLEEAKRHLRVDHALDDDDIGLKINAASAAVLAYIGDTQYLFLDTGGELVEFDTTDTGTAPEEAALRALHLARQATLLLLGDFYRHRDSGAATSAPGADLPLAVVALLRQLRMPTIA